MPRYYRFFTSAMPAKYRRPRRSLPLASALWLAAGAAAGVLIGVAVADRSAAGRALGRRLGQAVRLLHSLAGRAADDALESDDENTVEEGPYEDWDDAELGGDAAEEDLVDADDARLDARVLAAFEQDPILAHRAIAIDAPRPGTILLTGRVPIARDIAHAVTIARGTPGVTRVEHRLRVRPPRRGASGTESRV
jgi:hypothetical protein